MPKETAMTVTDPKLQAIFKETYEVSKGFVNEVLQLPILKLIHPTQGEDPIIIKDVPHREIDGQNVPLYTHYHTGTKKHYTDPEVVIMASRKTRLPKFNKPNEDQHNELVGGFLLEDKFPFVIFMKSLSLSPWWDLHKALSEKSKETGIPSFALIVKMGVGKRDSMDGTFKGIKISEGKMTGAFVKDGDLVKLLAEKVQTVEDGIDSFINRKLSGEPAVEVQGDYQGGTTHRPTGETVDPNDLPV